MVDFMTRPRQLTLSLKVSSVWLQLEKDDIYSSPLTIQGILKYLLKSCMIGICICHSIIECTLLISALHNHCFLKINFHLAQGP